MATCTWEGCDVEVPISNYGNGQTYQPKYCKPHRRQKAREAAAARGGYVDGIKKDSKGYIQIRVELEDGTLVWKPAHRIVMEDMLGRELRPGEEVWHKNGVADDNRPENLELRLGLSTSLADLTCPHCGEPYAPA